MAVIRHGPSPEDHYSLVPNCLARDGELSLQAKGLYVYLRSHREGWEMSTERIGEALGVSRDTVSKYVKELETAGYLDRDRVHDESGQFTGMAYTLNIEPLPKKPGNGKNPRPVKPASGDSRQHKKTNSFKKTNSLKEEQPPNPQRGNDTAPDGFDKWWETYPKKVGKGQARTAFKKALKKIDLDALTTKTQSFSDFHEKAGTEKRFIPNPATWLNGERWDDELDAPVLASSVDQFRRTQPLDYEEIPF